MRRAINDTVEYIKVLAQNMAGCEADCVVLAILLDLGIPVNCDGFEYLKAAVLMQYRNPTLGMVSDIYQALADKYGSISPEIIAASIRACIRMSCSRGNTEVWDRYLPALPGNRKRPPTNAEVVAGLARITELWMGCSQAYLRQQNREVVNCERK